MRMTFSCFRWRSKLHLSQRALGVHRVLERVGDLFYRHLLVGVDVARAAHDAVGALPDGFDGRVPRLHLERVPAHLEVAHLRDESGGRGSRERQRVERRIARSRRGETPVGTRAELTFVSPPWSPSEGVTEMGPSSAGPSSRRDPPGVSSGSAIGLRRCRCARRVRAVNAARLATEGRVRRISHRCPRTTLQIIIPFGSTFRPTVRSSKPRVV